MECSRGGGETEEHSAPDISITQVEVDKTCNFSVYQYTFQDPFAFSEQHSAY